MQSTEEFKVYKQYAVRAFLSKDRVASAYIANLTQDNVIDEELLQKFYMAFSGLQSKVSMIRLGKGVIKQGLTIGKNILVRKIPQCKFLHPESISTNLSDEEYMALLHNCSKASGAPENLYFVIGKTMLLDLLNIELSNILQDTKGIDIINKLGDGILKANTTTVKEKEKEKEEEEVIIETSNNKRLRDDEEEVVIESLNNKRWRDDDKEEEVIIEIPNNKRWRDDDEEVESLPTKISRIDDEKLPDYEDVADETDDTVIDYQVDTFIDSMVPDHTSVNSDDNTDHEEMRENMYNADTAVVNNINHYTVPIVAEEISQDDSHTKIADDNDEVEPATSNNAATLEELLSLVRNNIQHTDDYVVKEPVPKLQFSYE
ncbi:GbNV_gp67-like protein [Crangon crangon nudivirus]|uniref:GbNV_gp67-like protein n=1 Tax=Crangon crangon nudivirus TaxID=2880838 RepID=A0AAE8Y281_9VIRU|nr:GbNV_gp67-like protein [Crangon crangon nudivirus]UBZ25584.1 GbNV_gp67-like protein [Crangon crangon nudivirus]